MSVLNKSFFSGYKDGLLSPEECVELPYFDTLRNIRKTLETAIPDFPYNENCNLTSKVVHIITTMEGTPLAEASGSYTPQAMFGNSKSYGQAFNPDYEKELHISLDLCMFFSDLPEIVIAHFDKSNLREDPFHTRAQRKHGFEDELEPILEAYERIKVGKK